MKQAPLTRKRWRRVEYERLVDLGAFDREPVELLGGQLIVAEPKGSEHATAVDMADDALRPALPPGWIVRVQNPIALDDESAPEPDIAVVGGTRAEYPGVTAPYGWRYASVERVTAPRSVAPLGVPTATIAVAALLPS